jgi:hypothetical protein
VEWLAVWSGISGQFAPEYAINEYISGTDRKGTPSSWINSGGEYKNPWFTPGSLSITDSFGVPLPMPVRNDAEIYVQIHGEVHQFNP